MLDPDDASAATAGIRETYVRQSVDYHAHGRAQLMFAERGLMTIRTQEGLWMLPPTRALFLPSDQRHALDSRGTVDLATLYIAPGMPDFPSWETCRVINVSPLMREIILRLVDAPWDYAPRSSAYRAATVLMDELNSEPSLPYHLPEPTDSRAKRFCAHMREHLDDRERLTEIAKRQGTTVRTLERVFQRQLGMSVGTWVQQLRLLSAVQMLTLGSSVSEVSFALGYSNPSSFIAVFRQAFGVSPGKYAQ